MWAFSDLEVELLKWQPVILGRDENVLDTSNSSVIEDLVDQEFQVGLFSYLFMDIYYGGGMAAGEKIEN